MDPTLTTSGSSTDTTTIAATNGFSNVDNTEGASDGTSNAGTDDANATRLDEL